jgi:hypothetical protein
MNSTGLFFSFIRTTVAVLGNILDHLFVHGEGDIDNRCTADGTELFGEHNFRTGKMDSGSDPDGWYEEDI